MLNDPNWDKGTKVEPDEVGQHLLRAAEYIDKHGWCQNMLFDAAGRVCLEGALMSTDQTYLERGLINALDRLRSVTGHHCGWPWNDKPERTKDEVVNTLRTAAYAPKY